MTNFSLALTCWSRRSCKRGRAAAKSICQVVQSGQTPGRGKLSRVVTISEQRRRWSASPSICAPTLACPSGKHRTDTVHSIEQKGYDDDTGSTRGKQRSICAEKIGQVQLWSLDRRQSRTRPL